MSMGNSISPTENPSADRLSALTAVLLKISAHHRLADVAHQPLTGEANPQKGNGQQQGMADSPEHQ